ncbi:DNA-protecting protein DprA [Alkalicaulis satelles]|uniref:DNA-protecting protein DprA n=1 Tax=Alkalicaulis satelles TaxID=2609175 RepID=A0A5M6ZLL1_9PROT|nr:DNA-processing protein DprA [Alkalicaulis satelles]KAA5804825.1 DNA-protecting protein DprA [Alkalicaulis satelles]
MNAARLTRAGRLDWLRLARTSGVGPVTFRELITRFGTPEAALAELPRLARRGGRTRRLDIVTREAAEAELERHDELGARLVCTGEPDFPKLLAALDIPPPVLTLLGPLNPDAQPACALVGARNASAVGLRFAGDLARELGQRGVTIVSGLARGIDGAAHAAALDTGTIAVVGGGVARIYPPEHHELHHAIARQGLIISETPPDHVAQARDFPRRNRLISGLSLGVLVVEAAERSGSLITARLAGEQGREVMAVPGSPLDPRARGTNRLLREGAALIESAEDVIAVLQNTRPPALKEPGGWEYEDEPGDRRASDEAADAVRERIAELLSPAPVSKDELARLTGAPASAVLAALVELELAGRCEVQPGGMVRAAYPDD